MIKKLCLSVSLGTLFLFFPLNETWACPVPVFYYALSEWPSDPHSVAIGKTPKGPSVGSIKDAIDNLTANINADPTSQSVPSGHVQIRFPNATQPWWDAPLPGADLKSGLKLLTDSPARQNIVKQIVSGVSVVWLFLESGDKKADEAALARLSNRLKYLQKVTELPPAQNGQEGEGVREIAVPLKIAFSIVSVRRNDPLEVGLIAQILNVAPDLQNVKSPMAFPVFGRARILPPLYGKDFTEANIDEASLFAVGSCSCEIKEANPGTDLLVTADWDTLFAGPQKTGTNATARN